MKVFESKVACQAIFLPSVLVRALRLYYRAITNFKGLLRVVCVQINVCQALISERSLWRRGEEFVECSKQEPFP